MFLSCLLLEDFLDLEVRGGSNRNGFFRGEFRGRRVMGCGLIFVVAVEGIFGRYVCVSMGACMFVCVCVIVCAYEVFRNIERYWRRDFITVLHPFLYGGR